MSAGRRFYRNGIVYSAQDPFATAMVVEGGRVAWVGPDAGAGPWVQPDDEVVDLAGRLVTPVFVDLLAAPGDAAGAAGVLAPAAGPVDPSSLLVVDPDAGDLVDPAGLADRGRGVLAVPARHHRDPVDLAALAAAGVVLALSSGRGAPLSPWAVLRAAVFPDGHPERGVSARAAFLAHTRGPRRLAATTGTVLEPGGDGGQGGLSAGAGASYAVWDVDELLVQTPDRRVAAWSTDARAGTPVLPDLAPGAELPVCRRTAIGGRVTYDTLSDA
ncbi:hypothetical protein ACFFKU_12105 [Kineococcus gynurae]|uniref:Amidohydrolase family protein n=1 Tax=Kineococcus gynurae TaxID=452979 RepID=A0ABV5LR28_9ACTN